MKYIKYFLQFIFAIITFIIFKFLGPNLSSNLSGKLFEFIGPFFRSKVIINSELNTYEITDANNILILESAVEGIESTLK